MSTVVYVSALAPAVFEWLDHHTLLQRCLYALDAVRGVDRVVCVSLKSGIDAVDDALDRVRRRFPPSYQLDAPLALPDVLDVDLLTAAQRADAALKEDTAALRHPTTPFVTAATVETCLSRADGTAVCRTALLRPLVAVDSRTPLGPQPVAVAGVEAVGRWGGKVKRLHTTPVDAIEAIDVTWEGGWELARALVDAGVR